jgi:hypothetical protein
MTSPLWPKADDGSAIDGLAMQYPARFGRLFPRQEPSWMELCFSQYFNKIKRTGR